MRSITPGRGCAGALSSQTDLDLDLLDVAAVHVAVFLGQKLAARGFEDRAQDLHFALKKPCLTLRDTTEWTETLKGSANRLVGTKPESIIRAVRTIEKNPPKVKPGLIYGDGRTAERIARSIKSYLAR